METILIVLIAVVVIAGGAALMYFLLTRYFKEDAVKNSKAAPATDKKAEKQKIAEEKKAAANAAAQEKARIAAEKRKADMMKNMIQTDPKVLEHPLIRKAADEITKYSQSIDTVTVMANRIDWTTKEEYSQYPSGNIFFDDPALHRLEAGEMKLVAEHLFSLIKKTGFEMEEVGSGEKGTHRYHVDKYIIKAL